MASNLSQIVDLKWHSGGDLILDSSGDISFTDSAYDSIQDMVITRLKALSDSWKLYYGIGADLDTIIGDTIVDELETTIQKNITQALTNQFLQIGTFTVETMQISTTITAYVYIGDELIASEVIDLG